MIPDSKIHSSIHSFGSNKEYDIINDPSKIQTQKITPLKIAQKTIEGEGWSTYKQKRSSSPISLTAPKRKERFISP